MTDGVARRSQLEVAAAHLDTDGRVLVQQRPAGKMHAGLWEFPGGKVEAGEAPETALGRELAEELGIQTDPEQFGPATFASAPAGDRHLILLLYTVPTWQGQPKALDAAALAWVHPAQLADWPMPPADYPLAAHLSRAVLP
jgi:8-oxo-dGTP diphosphatase